MAHSLGVKALSRAPTVVQSPATVRSVALRSSAFSLAKAFSMGLKSGE